MRQAANARRIAASAASANWSGGAARSARDTPAGASGMVVLRTCSCRRASIIRTVAHRPPPALAVSVRASPAGHPTPQEAPVPRYRPGDTTATAILTPGTQVGRR
ncbi:hypothetical protein GCM10012279_26950 [Micromonospora yangpuensis]|nr:hypothetical protein GCM10012279_26950 [Micromonospora yangpuensis]